MTWAVTRLTNSKRRKHTGERPFRCHCGKAFSRLDNLRQHAQTVHADESERNEIMMAELVSLHSSLAASAAQSQHAHAQVLSKRGTSPSSNGGTPTAGGASGASAGAGAGGRRKSSVAKGAAASAAAAAAGNKKRLSKDHSSNSGPSSQVSTPLAAPGEGGHSPQSYLSPHPSLPSAGQAQPMPAYGAYPATYPGQPTSASPHGVYPAQGYGFPQAAPPVDMILNPNLAPRFGQAYGDPALSAQGPPVPHQQNGAAYYGNGGTFAEQGYAQPAAPPSFAAFTPTGHDVAAADYPGASTASYEHYGSQGQTVDSVVETPAAPAAYQLPVEWRPFEQRRTSLQSDVLPGSDSLDGYSLGPSSLRSSYQSTLSAHLQMRTPVLRKGGAASPPGSSHGLRPPSSAGRPGSPTERPVLPPLSSLSRPGTGHGPPLTSPMVPRTSGSSAAAPPFSSSGRPSSTMDGLAHTLPSLGDSLGADGERRPFTASSNAAASSRPVSRGSVLDPPSNLYGLSGDATGTRPLSSARLPSSSLRSGLSSFSQARSSQPSTQLPSLRDTPVTAVGESPRKTSPPSGSSPFRFQVPPSPRDAVGGYGGRGGLGTGAGVSSIDRRPVSRDRLSFGPLPSLATSLGAKRPSISDERDSPSKRLRPFTSGDIPTPPKFGESSERGYRRGDLPEGKDGKAADEADDEEYRPPPKTASVVDSNGSGATRRVSIANLLDHQRSRRDVDERRLTTANDDPERLTTMGSLFDPTPTPSRPGTAVQQKVKEEDENDELAASP